MTRTAPPKAPKHPRPICPEALRYEELKAALRKKGLSRAEYEQAVRRAAMKAGI